MLIMIVLVIYKGLVTFTYIWVLKIPRFVFRDLINVINVLSRYLINLLLDNKVPVKIGAAVSENNNQSNCTPLQNLLSIYKKTFEIKIFLPSCSTVK